MTKRTARGHEPEQAANACEGKFGVHLPFWLQVGLLVVVSVVAVGLLAFLPVYFRTEATMESVAAKYRELSFLAVENNVLSLLQKQVKMVELVAKIQATFDSGNFFDEELRKLLYLSLQNMPEVAHAGVGHGTGDYLGLAREPVSRALFWLMTGNSSRYRGVTFPALTWG
eukprot:RCo018585